MRGSVSGMGRRVRRTLAAALAVLLAITVSGAAAPLPARSVTAPSAARGALSTVAVARQRHHAPAVTTGTVRTAIVSGGSISGHVDDGTSGIEGVWVYLYDKKGEYVNNLDIQTDLNGDYVASGIPAGDYIVQFDPSGLTDNPFVFQWYSASDKPDLATPVTIVDGESATAVDATLATGGKSIAGIARDGAGAAAPGADVVLWQKFGSVWVDSLYTTTDPTGHFAFGHIPDGSYRVACWGENGTEWVHPGVPEISMGDDVVVSANPVEAVDVVFSPQAIADYTVTSGGSPLADVAVQPYFKTPHSGWKPVPGYLTSTGLGGTATSEFMLPGDYKFEFKKLSYADVWHHDAANMTAATAVTVGAAPVSGGPSVSITQAMTLKPTYTPQSVYRFFNLKAGVHFYTSSESEKNDVINTLGGVYRFEGPSYTINLANPNNTLPVYRFYNVKKGVHFYTASEAEKNTVINTLGGTYRFEGPSYNVSRTSVNAFPVYRFYNLKQGVHFYTASESEKNTVINTLGGVYRFEGISYWVGN